MHIRRATAGVLAAVLFAGCSSADEDKTTPDAVTPDPLEIFSWWIAEGEAEALDDLLKRYKAQTGGDVINAAIATGSTSTQELLRERLKENKPPDLFQTTAGGNVLTEFTVFGTPPENKLQSLDSLYDANNWRTVFPAHVLKGVSFEGQLYGIPINIHRQNVLFYNKRIFQQIGAADPPVTLADFYDAAEKAKAANITPLAMSYRSSGSQIDYTFLCAMLARSGASFRQDYFAGKLAADDPKLGEAIDEFSKMLSYTRKDFAITNWADAANELFTGKSAMFFHGDWVKGLLMAKGWTPDVDFGMVSCPGGDAKTYVYNSDAFTMPKGPPNPTAAETMLKVIASVEGQVGFNKYKGSIPARTDIDPALLDPVSRRFLDDLKNATYVANDADIPSAMKTYRKSLVPFAKGEIDKAALIDVFVKNYVKAE